MESWKTFRDFWVRETGTGQQVAQLHERYMMMMVMMMTMKDFNHYHQRNEQPLFSVDCKVL